MPDFVPTGDLTLPAVKSNIDERPIGIAEENWWDAADYNTMRQALLDIQTAFRARLVDRVLADGGEESIDVEFDTPRAHANYNVRLQLGKAANAVSIRPDTDSFTVDGFTILCDAPMTGGDVVMFTVEDLSL